MTYRWIWYPSSAPSRRAGCAHAFADGASGSICTYVMRAKADLTVDVGLLLKPVFCLHCRSALKVIGVEAVLESAVS